MDLLFLGTGAAEGFPALFCSCEHCEAARVAAGPNFRRRTSALIDDDLLIDVGPDLLASVHALRLRLDRVHYVLQTHSHSDHLLDSNFTFRKRDFAGTPPAPWELCGSPTTIARISSFCNGTSEQVSLRTVHAFETFNLGPYTVTALLARHDMTIDPLFFAIQREGRALLWANDTGPFFPETWEALEELRRKQVKFNAVAIEATMGTYPSSNDTPGGHMTFKECGWHHQELGRRGLLAPGSRHYAHHFSHNSCGTHEDIAAALAPFGVQPAYDGLRITL
ncbi:MAG: MBL fold metallo-hydrolase [Chloroflexi bacterium]|nr:MBL fold metallo-hydrolase [Chloroflexota bacterium]